MPTSRSLWLLCVIVAITLCSAAAISAMQLQHQRAYTTASARLATEKVRVLSTIERLSHLPVAVAQQPDVQRLLSDPFDVAVQKRVNAYLFNVATAAEASILYVLRKDALAVASSDYESGNSLIGNKFAFRPYFINAINQRKAHYFAIGITTGKPGYYIAQPIIVKQNVVGVAVVKISLQSLQNQWSNAPDQWLLLDEHDVVVLASDPSMRYQTATPLTAALREEFKQERKYANQPLPVLPILQNAAIAEAGLLQSLRSRYVQHSTPFTTLDWRLVKLVDTQLIKRTGIWVLLTMALLLGVALLGLLYWRERRRKQRLGLIAAEAERVNILNNQLQDEVTERKRAEADLRQAQSELIQTSKLAAMGQMSAAIAHEVNQPLSALKTYSASTRLLIERSRHDEALKNLTAMESVTDRMASLTGDLKVFARKSDTQQSVVALKQCLHSLVQHHNAPLIAPNVPIAWVAPEEEILVVGNQACIEQVVSNLIRNALDATKDQPEACVELELSGKDNRAVIRVSDNGVGLDDNRIHRVFDPFFTTKPMGEGLGLGLAIAHGIVEEMNGQLRAKNRTDIRGAVFEVTLLRQYQSVGVA